MFKMDQENNSGGGGGESRDFVAEASKIGWVPKDKWTGPEDKWVDAAEFVERGETVLPIIRARNKELEEKVRTVNAELAQAKQDGVEFRAFMDKASKKEKEELEGRLQKALVDRAEAVRTGDGVKFTEAEEAVEAIKAAAAKAGEVKPPAEADGGPVHPDLAPWIVKNPWYKDNEEMRYEANGIAIAINARTKLVGLPLFEKVREKMMKLYPEVFEDDNDTRGASRVDDGRESSGSEQTRRGKGKAHTYENLPADAKSTCDRYIKNGWVKKGQKPEEFRKQFADNYDWEG